MSKSPAHPLVEVQTHFQAGRYRNVLENCEQILAGSPANLAVLDIWRSALAKLGAIGQIIEATETRLALDEDLELRKNLVYQLIGGCDSEGALRVAKAGLTATPDDIEFAQAIIDAHLQIGQHERAVSYIGKLPPSADRAARWLSIGDLERAATDVADIDSDDARLVKARAAAWSGRWDAARAYAASIPADGAEWIGAQCVLAAACWKDEDVRTCRRILESVIETQPNDPEPYVAAAVLALRGGQFDAGWDAARAARSRARCYLPVLELLELGLWALQDVESPFLLNLENLVRRAPRLQLRADNDITAHEFVQAIDRFSGNYSSFPTLLDGNTVTRINIAPDPRTACKRVQRSLQLRGFDAVLADFDKLITRYQRHPLTYTHRGEMLLWLGDYLRAAADFEAARDRCDRTVWSYIGLATAQLASGDAESALATLDDGAQRAYVGRTAPAIRGEALRRLGRFEQAREFLEVSLKLRPRRVSAWINLALVAQQTGDRATVQTALANLKICCPTFLDDLVREIGGFDETRPKVFEHALTMMRGNRSSNRLTYFTGDGKAWFVDSTRDHSNAASR